MLQEVTEAGGINNCFKYIRARDYLKDEPVIMLTIVIIQ